MLTSLGPSGVKALRHLFLQPPELPERERWMHVRAQILVALINVSPGGPEAAQALGDEALASIADAASSALHDEWLLPAASRIEPWILERSRDIQKRYDYKNRARCSITALRSAAASGLLAPSEKDYTIFESCPGRFRALMESGSAAGLSAVIKRAVRREYEFESTQALSLAPSELLPQIAQEAGTYFQEEGLTESAAYRLVSVLRQMGEAGRSAIVSGGRPAARVLVRTFNGDSDEVVALLRAMGEDAVVELDIRSKTKDGEQEPHWIALLGYLRVPDAGPRLLEFAASRDSRVRRAAARGLGALAEARYLPQLMDLLMDADGAVRASAARAVSSLGRAALPIVLAAADRPGDDVRSEMVRKAGVCALLHLGEDGEAALRVRQRSGPIVQCFEDDPTPDVARTAMALAPTAVVGRLTAERGTNYKEMLFSAYPFLAASEREAVTRFLRVWLTDGKGSFAFAATLAQGLCLDALAPELARAKGGDITYALSALRALSDEAVIPAVRSRLAEETEPFRRANLQAILGARGDEGAARAADTYRRDNSLEGERERAVKRYFWVGVGGLLGLVLAAVWASLNQTSRFLVPAIGLLYGAALCLLTAPAIAQIMRTESGGTAVLWVAAALAVTGALAFGLEFRLPGVRGMIGRGLLWTVGGFFGTVTASMAISLLFVSMAFFSFR